MKGYIHSIETFGTVDGPGIRFVLFMKGCPMRCLYCHNPDTWTMDGAKIFEDDEIVSQILRYKNYYKHGGVTISGGEPLLQIDFILSLTKKLKNEGLHVAIDTSGITFKKDDPEILSKFDELLESVDLFLLDIKHINNQEHIRLTSQSNERILDFAKYLDSKNKEMWIRHVLVPGLTTDERYLKELREFIDSLHNVTNVEVLPYHTMGVNKYKELGIKYPLEGVEPPSKEQIETAKNILKK